MWLQILLCKAGRERGPQVSLLEARKASTSGLAMASQNKANSSSLIYQDLLPEIISILHFQETTKFSTSGPLFQAGQQWQVN